MSVMADIGDNDVVLRRGVVGQIGRQLIKRLDVRNTFGRLWVQPVVDIIEVHLGEVFNVKDAKIERAVVIHGAPKVGLRVNLPGNTGICRSLTKWLFVNS